ncbi:hypothetical protein M9434_002532 [Picochlorum sp. BPE23]|nr:hypothetical protein M9434_003374 [Picochlorum sp. BPE23]KAI8114364.1 hypothetical protein M9434_002489 [Picochlorum sp. BPE23]KAI8114408.1 hypothetical protein M9434_002532 [Picochlorum sp. BPE23]
MCERKKYSFDSAIYHVEEIKNTVNKGIKSNDRITDEKREEYRREAREWKERKDREMSDCIRGISVRDADSCPIRHQSFKVVAKKILKR